MADSGDSIKLRLSFASPDDAYKIGNALMYAGFPEVVLYCVVEASADADSADLQLLHDRVKELGPLIDKAKPGSATLLKKD